ncbi:hypothetical protein [Polyangium spumosum]|uniref:Uncharacterized protein n=1 Tax=Polyangium spumosum TaxID=889282 RepID=A0A6N7Q2Z0_9BACT|nr:hypothetical protein [Polyangium spumosum]MRG98399.1 hypothetical protein [Polyangium spumosum]
MDRATFASRLETASLRARDFARELVLEHLPDEIRFDVVLNASYDGNPLHPDEVVFPGDGERFSRADLKGVDATTVLDLLLRDGMVPEWINLTVTHEHGGKTFIEVLCCGRFTANESLLYHAEEGYPPFHVLGPSIPPHVETPSRSRYSLYWSMEVHDDELERLDGRDQVQTLCLRGGGIHDHTLERLARLHRLRSLRLEGTSVRGEGLVHAVGGALQYLMISGSLVRIDGLACLPSSLSSLVSLTLDESPLVEGELAHLQRMTRVHTLELTNTSVTDEGARLLAAAPTLRELDLSGTAISDGACAHLGRMAALETLSLDRTAVTDAGVRHLANVPRLRFLSLAGTGVTDRGAASLVDSTCLQQVDLHDTQVTPTGVALLRKRKIYVVRAPRRGNAVPAS